MQEERKSVRASDVAKLANVSRATVSRTFTEGAYVSEEARAKVLRAADLLGYRPNALAQSLMTNRTKIVGVVTTDLNIPFYAELLQTLASAIEQAGMTTLLLMADPSRNDDLVEKLLSYQVDGLILTDTTLTPRMAHVLTRSEKTVISINRFLDDENMTSITCANMACGEAVADLLVDKGCRTISYIAGVPDTQREFGFRKRLSERGVLLNSFKLGNFSYDSGLVCAREILHSGDRPDGVFCANDLMAMAYIDVARSEFGLSAPEDYLIIGFDNSIEGSWLSYQLSSVDQNIAKMVEITVEQMLAGIAGEARQGGQIQVPGILVERASTAR